MPNGDRPPQPYCSKTRKARIHLILTNRTLFGTLIHNPRSHHRRNLDFNWSILQLFFACHFGDAPANYFHAIFELSPQQINARQTPIRLQTAVFGRCLNISAITSGCGLKFSCYIQNLPVFCPQDMHFS